MFKKRYLTGFTLLELMIVMMIIGIGLMTFTPKLAYQSIGTDKRLEFFDKLINDHLQRAIELGRPISFLGFKGSANIITHDGEHEEIPDTSSIQSVKVNRYETGGEEYAVRVYPDGLCDYFEITSKDGYVIESIPLLMRTRYKETNED
ncbi:MAG: type II secretion system protein [Deferribacterales bacterium]|nr:type II secretion system protein [Deferribacterales bacterium]